MTEEEEEVVFDSVRRTINTGKANEIQRKRKTNKNSQKMVVIYIIYIQEKQKE